MTLPGRAVVEVSISKLRVQRDIPGRFICVQPLRDAWGLDDGPETPNLMTGISAPSAHNVD